MLSAVIGHGAVSVVLDARRLGVCYQWRERRKEKRMRCTAVLEAEADGG
jgi:hypothetical protein